MSVYRPVGMLMSAHHSHARTSRGAGGGLAKPPERVQHGLAERLEELASRLVQVLGGRYYPLPPLRLALVCPEVALCASALDLPPGSEEVGFCRSLSVTFGCQLLSVTFGYVSVTLAGLTTSSRRISPATWRWVHTRDCTHTHAGARSRPLF
jgi:hypothetical protein